MGKSFVSQQGVNAAAKALARHRASARVQEAGLRAVAACVSTCPDARTAVQCDQGGRFLDLVVDAMHRHCHTPGVQSHGAALLN